MSGNFEFHFTPKQKELWDVFFDAPMGNPSWIVNVGGKGSGKTELTTYIVLRLLFDPQYKGSKILIARESLRDLENTLISSIERYLARVQKTKQKDPINHDKNRQVIEFKPTGSKLFYMSLSDKNDQYKSVLSYEFNVVIIDEADRISQEAFTEADTRLRYPHPFQRGMINLNPVSEEHWIYKYFVKNPKSDVLVYKTTTYDLFFYEEILLNDFQDNLRSKKWLEYKAPNQKRYFVDMENQVRYEVVGLSKTNPQMLVVKKFLFNHPTLERYERKSFSFRYVMMEGNWGSVYEENTFFSEHFTEAHVIHEPITLEYLTMFRRFYVGLDFGFNKSAMVLIGEHMNGQIVILDGAIFSNTTYEKFIHLVDERLKKILPQGIRTPLIYGDIAGTKREQSDGLSLIRKIEQTFNIRIYTNYVKFAESIDMLIHALSEKLPYSTDPPQYRLVVHKDAKLVIEGFMGGFKVGGTRNNYAKIEDDYYEHLFDAMRYGLYPILRTGGRQSMPRIITPTI